MDASRGTGIPAISLRTDDNESAREWNKMREAVISIFESNNPGTPNEIARRLYGFRPIARVDGDDPGVGITVGRLMFLEANAITTASGDRNEAVEVIPTLEGTALDADPSPRKYLAAEDYEAWVVWREMGDDEHTARIEFGVEGAGPGSLDRDEKAQRLATFTVNYPGGTDAEDEQPTVQIKKQFIRDEFSVPTIRHQFKVHKTDDNKIKVDKGFLIYLKGWSDPLVSYSLEAAESSEITVTGNGSIWLNALWYHHQHSESRKNLSGGSGSDYVRLRMYRLDNIASASFTFRAAAPTSGINDMSIFVSGTLWFEIAKVELVGGDVFITDQIVNGPIYVNELVDGIVD